MMKQDFLVIEISHSIFLQSICLNFLTPLFSIQESLDTLLRSFLEFLFVDSYL